MMEQSRHARKFFDLAWFGIGAAGAVDPIAGFAATLGTLRCTDSKIDSPPSQTRVCFDYVSILRYH